MSNDEDTRTAATKVFICSTCNLTEEYQYFGKKPPESNYLNLLQDSYVMQDPFSHPKEKRMLLLGSNCSLCMKPVCSSSECSVFYNLRYCQQCAAQNLQLFPRQLQAKLNLSQGTESDLKK